MRLAIYNPSYLDGFFLNTSLSEVAPLVPGTHPLDGTTSLVFRSRGSLRDQFIGKPYNLSGHGNFDLGAYDAYLKGELHNFEHPQENISAALEMLPRVEM